MARELPYIAAIGEAIHQEMERDDTVLYFGQNLATSADDPFLKAFGGDRVRVTPISETAEIGMAVGAALAGYRPVVELYMAEFMLVAMDQVVNEAPRFHYMSGGQVKVPLVLKAGYGFTAGWAGQHTGSIYGMFMGVPGLKVAVPATAADAKGLMTAAIRDDNPVVFFHHYLLTLEHGEVPEGEHVVPLGEAAVRREGDDVTIVAIGWMVGRALAAAEQLAAEGVDAEVIDPRHARAARHGDDPRIGGEDRPPRRRRPVDAPRIRGRGDRGGGRLGGLRRAEGADPARDGARCDDPLQRADGGVPPPGRGEDRRRRAGAARLGGGHRVGTARPAARTGIERAVACRRRACLASPIVRGAAGAAGRAPPCPPSARSRPAARSRAPGRRRRRLVLGDAVAASASTWSPQPRRPEGVSDHAASCQAASCQAALAQAASDQAASIQAALDHAASAQAASAQAASCHAASFCTASIQAAASKTGVEPPVGSATTNRLRPAFGFGAEPSLERHRSRDLADAGGAERAPSCTDPGRRHERALDLVRRPAGMQREDLRRRRRRRPEPRTTCRRAACSRAPTSVRPLGDERRVVGTGPFM